MRSSAYLLFDSYYSNSFNRASFSVILKIDVMALVITASADCIC
jgi:hypothetical protein